MSLRLTEIAHIAEDTCRARFVRGEAEEVEAVFTLVRDGPVIGAVPDPDVLAHSQLGASEVRTIIDLVVRFCLAAQRESRVDR
jgi:hypothetical protein